MKKNRVRRFRSPYLPIRPAIKRERLVIALEKQIKGFLFQCSMCGNCLLQETAFICPMLCPKGLRNGPCGSGVDNRCCVEPSRPCIWHLIYKQAERLNRMDRLMEIQAPLDGERVGHETWGTVLSKARERGLLSLMGVLRGRHRREEFQRLFRDLRQPDWWQGDDHYHPPASFKPVSRLQASMKRGEFVVTAEVHPPAGAGADHVQELAHQLRGRIHAANVTENPMATPRMSSLACCLLLAQNGIEPVLQLTGRDYNRYFLQSEALGASILGIHNVLCLTGDPPIASRGPASGLPFDLDATQMLWILRRLRDERRFLDGRFVSEAPRYFLGAAGSPNDPDPAHEALRIEKKVNAGAQFIQTQLVYDVTTFQRWLQALDQRSLLTKVHILVGIGPLHSVKTARFLNERIPGVFVPPRLIERLERSLSPEQTGIEIALELIQQVKALPGVAGIHVMCLGHDSILPRLASLAGWSAHFS
ncbi:MAG: methylenetetrahydrofolate reductase C-terminal domain-containing protein [Anaerolineales bacterium]